MPPVLRLGVTFALTLLAGPGLADPPAPGDRPPTDAEFESAKAAFAAVGGQLRKESVPSVESEAVYFGEPGRLTADNLAKLPDLPFRYFLQLVVARDTPPDALRPLARLGNLRAIVISTDPREPDRPADLTRHVTELRAVPNLSQINVSDFTSRTELTDAVAGELARFPSLRRVAGSGPISDAGLEMLARCPQLTAVSLPDCKRITDAGLAYLARMPSLRALSVQYCPQVTAAGVRHFTADPRLTRLSIGGERMTAEALVEVGKLSTLEDINLTPFKKPIGDEGVKHLGRLAHLRRLTGGLLTPTDDGMKVLSGAAALEHLHLVGTALTDDGYKELARLRGLTNLAVMQAKGMTDAGLGHLAGLERLENLDVYNTGRTTDAGWRAFAAARGGGLRRLSLHESSVTDAFVAALPAPAPGLESLTLYTAPGVTAGSIEPLTKLPHLRQLHLSYTSLGENDLAELRRRLPAVNVVGAVRRQ